MSGPDGARRLDGTHPASTPVDPGPDGSAATDVLDRLRPLPRHYGVVSERDARLAALNLIEDAIAARRAEEAQQAQRQRVEEQLRESEEHFQRAVEDAPIPMVMHAEDGTVLQTSRAWTALTGLEAKEISNFDQWFDQLVGLQSPAVRARIREVFDRDRGIEQVDMEVRTSAGELRYWIYSSSAPGRLRDGRRYAVGMIVDITDRRQAEDALRSSEEQLRQARDVLEVRVAERTAQLADVNASLEKELQERQQANHQIRSLIQRLVHAQEEERRSVARDIHDHLGQQMTALRLQLARMAEASPDDAVLAATLESTQALAEELDRSIDFITSQLRPYSLDHLPFAAALDTLVREWSERFGVAARCSIRGTKRLRLSPQAQTHLYRFAQEALQNVFKHAGASQVTVSLVRRDADIVLTIRDDGRGFAAAKPPGGLGLISMRERATLLGGSVRIASTDRRGTIVEMAVPAALVAEG